MILESAIAVTTPASRKHGGKVLKYVSTTTDKAIFLFQE